MGYIVLNGVCVCVHIWRIQKWIVNGADQQEYDGVKGDYIICHSYHL